ncbi:hypothetical protein GGER_17220 [Serratia rubidaea]
MKNRKIKLLLFSAAAVAVAALAVVGKIENENKTFLSVATASTGEPITRWASAWPMSGAPA